MHLEVGKATEHQEGCAKTASCPLFLGRMSYEATKPGFIFLCV